MKVHWTNKQINYETLILAGDIGGTNTNLALVAKEGDDFTILLECVFKTEEVTDFMGPLTKTLAEFNSKHKGEKPELSCLSGAGPIHGNSCKLTNASWSIDGDAIYHETGIKTKVINDFTALSYGILLLDIENSRQITKLCHPDGTIPEPKGKTRAIIGAGTGLGVGFISEVQGSPAVFPSEGGHMDFAAFDEQTYRLQQYLAKRDGKHPDAEQVVSGSGIVRIFQFFIEELKIPIEGIIAEIDSASPEDIPRMIGQNADRSAACKNILQFFISAYARFANTFATAVLPYGGLYLAGGIVTKDEPFFIEDQFFMRGFLSSYKPGIRKLLQSIPVYIVRDYSTSIYGAANAACWLLKD